MSDAVCDVCCERGGGGGFGATILPAIFAKVSDVTPLGRDRDG